MYKLKFPIKKDTIYYFLSSISSSYSQIFFSKHKLFALLLMLVTFANPEVGIMGLFAVIVSSLTAFILKLDNANTANGLYGFNSLLIGIGLGVYFCFSWQVLLIIALASVFTLFIAVSLQGVIGKYHLPFLSLPFLISLWAFLLASRQFQALGISERGIYFLNDLYALGGLDLVNNYEYLSTIKLPEIIRIYLQSLSAIFFQFNILTGLIISIGLLLHSRIAFTLSFLGLIVAFFFYKIVNVTITEVDYSYIGFNYILTAIAIGGYFLIPSARSFLSVFLLIPLVAVITISSNYFFNFFGLPIYSLPFNLIVILFLYVLKFRTQYSYKLSEVYNQFGSPEKNLYQFLNNKKRFRYAGYIQLNLPFYGRWNVAQGHDGEHTHQGSWRHAWDFNILNNDGQQFKNSGDLVEDYYCFNKPIVASAIGQVVAVVNDINDNEIGQVDLQHNWGNTLIIKHADGLYSKLSHLKKNSINVLVGDDVKSGQIVAKCGNSGRSPYPHLHFQLQSYPYIGAETIDFPISNYMLFKNGTYCFEKHAIPTINDVISNVDENILIQKAFNFIPGQQLRFITDNFTEIIWDIKVNAYNQSYIECKQTKAKAYFEQDKNMFYFTNFQGKTTSYLFFFFQSAYNVQKGFYKNLVIQDNFSLQYYKPKYIRYINDFISPFFQIIQSKFSIHYHFIDDELSPKKIIFNSKTEQFIMNGIMQLIEFEWIIDEQGLQKLTILKNNKSKEITRDDT